MAEAGSYPKPPLGAWRLEGSGSGFTLKDGSGKSKCQVVLSNLHFHSPGDEYCPAKGSVKVLGTYPLELFRRGATRPGASARTPAATYTAAKMVVGGKTEAGSFFLLWNCQDPSEIFSGGAEFGECTIEFLSGGPKWPDSSLGGMADAPTEAVAPRLAAVREQLSLLSDYL